MNLGIKLGFLRPSAYFHELEVSSPSGKIEVQTAGAPTPAGPCCTIGTVGDEVATSVENLTNMAGSNMAYLQTFPAGTHPHPIVVDGGFTGPSPAAAVTGFASYAAFVTLKASYEIIQEQSARQKNAEGVLANLHRFQRMRHETLCQFFQKFPSLSSVDPQNPSTVFGGIDVDAALQWVQQQIEYNTVFDRFMTIRGNERQAIYNANFKSYCEKPKRQFDIEGMQKVFEALRVTFDAKLNWYEVLHVKNKWGCVPANNKAWVLQEMRKALQKAKINATTPEQKAALNGLGESGLQAAVAAMMKFSPSSNKTLRQAALSSQQKGATKDDAVMFADMLSVVFEGQQGSAQPAKRDEIASMLNLLEKYKSALSPVPEPSVEEQNALKILVGVPGDGESWVDYLQSKKALLEHCYCSLQNFVALSPKARGQALDEQINCLKQVLKPLKTCLLDYQGSQQTDSQRPLLSNDAQFFMQQCFSFYQKTKSSSTEHAEVNKTKQPKAARAYYQTLEEQALEKFLRDGIFEARSEKIIPGYLAGTGISLLALGRFIPGATPLGQLVLAGYSAANAVLSLRDCKHSFIKLKAVRALLQGNGIPQTPKDKNRQTAWQAVEKHYRKMFKWALAGSVAWAVNTLGMLAMTAVNLVKWAAALLAAPFTLGLSIPTGLVTDTLTGWMSVAMFTATGAVAGAAVAGVPSNLKLRGRTYTPLKPPKAWEKLQQGQDVFNGQKAFTKDEVEQQLIENTHQHGVVREYRQHFFRSLTPKDTFTIQARRWCARLVMWGSLGALSGWALRMKFNNKVAAVRCLQPNAQAWQQQYDALKKLSALTPAPTQQTEQIVTELGSEDFDAYMKHIQDLPCIGDIAKVLARSLTVHSKNVLDHINGQVKPIRKAKPQAVFNAHALQNMGQQMAVGENGQEFLSIANTLAAYGPCCDTKYLGAELLGVLQVLGKENTNLQTFLRCSVFQAANQYLVYQRRKEIKEERAEWAELYMHQNAHEPVAAAA